MMRYILSVALVALLLSACKKDKFTTVPQISFKSFSPNTWYANSTVKPGPMMNIKLTDLEGDFGFNVGKDTSYVYVKNLTIPPYNVDSLEFPVLSSTNLGKNLDVTVSFDLQSGRGILQGTGIAHRTDTLYFEVYVKDFAKNKSNVVKSDPFYLVNP
ncbi:hypothetical protein [Ferruginibacter sp.]